MAIMLRSLNSSSAACCRRLLSLSRSNLSYTSSSSSTSAPYSTAAAGGSLLRRSRPLSPAYCPLQIAFQNVGPVPEELLYAMAAAYKRYMAYLDAFNPNEAYLRKKGRRSKWNWEQKWYT